MTEQYTEDEAFSADRRVFLKSGLIVATAASLWWPTPSEAAFLRGGRELTFKNMHTGEKFSGEYWENGRYLSDSFREIKKVMRDHRTGDQFPIDPRLIDIMFVLHKRMETDRPYEVFSGYRSPKTNAKLRKMSFGVAKKSLHMQGQAVDLSVEGVRLSAVRKEAIKLKAGGVGYYPSSGFLHIDTGRVRQW